MIPYQLPKSGELEQELWQGTQRLGTGELFALGLAHSFERETTLGLLHEEARIGDAEIAAGTDDPAFRNYQYEREFRFLRPEKQAHALSEEEYRASKWYRAKEDGSAAIEHTPHMTPQRAEILAEAYDRRQYEKMLLEKNADSFGRQALLFGASFLAQLPDPINFIPMGGSLAKGASLARKAGRGALEGAAGTALADALIFPVANERGEDFSFFDLALDITFGAAIGGGMGFAGGKIGQWREGRERAEFDELGKELTETLKEAGHDADAASRIAGQTLENLKAQNDGLPAARAMRKSLGGEGRVNQGAMMDLALKAVGEGEAVDVAGWRAMLGMKADWLPENYFRTAGLIESGERPYWGKLTLEEMLPRAEAFYKDNLAGKTMEVRGREVTFRGPSNGWGKIHGKTPDPDKLKLLPYVDRILTASEWVFTEMPRREHHVDSGMKMHHLLALVEYEGRQLEVRSVVREDSRGNFFYDFFNETEGPQNKTPPESQGPSAGGNARGGGKTGKGGSGGPLRQTEELTSNDPVFRNGSAPDVTIRGESDGVNLEIRDITPDMSPVPAQPVYRAPEITKGLDEELAALGIDKSGRSYDEVEAMRLNDEGRAAQEDMAELEAARLENERVDTREEIALALVPCIIGGL